MKRTFEATGLSLPVTGSQDEEKIRFDGKGVDQIHLHVETDSEDSDQSMLSLNLIEISI